MLLFGNLKWRWKRESGYGFKRRGAARRSVAGNKRELFSRTALKDRADSRIACRWPPSMFPFVYHGTAAGHRSSLWCISLHNAWQPATRWPCQAADISFSRGWINASSLAACLKLPDRGPELPCPTPRHYGVPLSTGTPSLPYTTSSASNRCIAI